MKISDKILPNKTRNLFDRLEFCMDVLIDFHGPDTDDGKRMLRAKKTLIELRRQSVRVSAVWLAELVTMLGMIVYNLIDKEGHAEAGLVVYPAMMAGAMYGGLLMDRMEKKKDIFKRQMDDQTPSR